MFGYVYITTNNMNGKVYVGQKKGKFNPRYLGSGLSLKLAVKNYGRESFSVNMLDIAKTKEELNLSEIKNIARIKTFFDKDHIYNISPGGLSGKIFEVNPMYGKKHKPETKRKISERLSLNFGSNHGNYNKIRNDNTRKKMSLSKKGLVTISSLNDNISKILKEKNIFPTESPSYIRNIIHGYRTGVYQKERTLIGNLNRLCQFLDCFEYKEFLIKDYKKNINYYKQEL